MKRRAATLLLIAATAIYTTAIVAAGMSYNEFYDSVVESKYAGENIRLQIVNSKALGSKTALLVIPKSPYKQELISELRQFEHAGFRAIGFEYDVSWKAARMEAALTAVFSSIAADNVLLCLYASGRGTLRIPPTDQRKRMASVIVLESSRQIMSIEGDVPSLVVIRAERGRIDQVIDGRARQWLREHPLVHVMVPSRQTATGLAGRLLMNGLIAKYEQAYFKTAPIPIRDMPAGVAWGAALYIPMCMFILYGVAMDKFPKRGLAVLVGCGILVGLCARIRILKYTLPLREQQMQVTEGYEEEEKLLNTNEDRISLNDLGNLLYIRAKLRGYWLGGDGDDRVDWLICGGVGGMTLPDRMEVVGFMYRDLRQVVNSERVKYYGCREIVDAVNERMIFIVESQERRRAAAAWVAGIADESLRTAIFMEALRTMYIPSRKRGEWLEYYQDGVWETVPAPVELVVVR